ncbi:hypothetical protein [Nocardioides sp. SR21]|uniref:hypothetical protein n=1 Tax=Nocardioides sp. SR21 TaxID=2919501 RepID=UPI001FA9C7A9|nr:hypothetical protein [Nocardioides sp. SR21]
MADRDPVSGGHSGLLLRDRKLIAILIAGGVMAFVVTAVIGFSGAVFSSTSSSPGNEYAAAGMGLTLARTGQLVDGSGMAPGDSRSGTQTVTNEGHRGRLTLDARGVDGQSPLAKVLAVVVQQTDPAQAQPAYDGPLTGLSSVLLGTLAPGESRSYRVTLTWPAGTGAGAAGTTTSLTFDWQIESVS